MKPDWKDAPAWAEYLAMDKDSIWWWYEYRPRKTSLGGYCPARDKNGGFIGKYEICNDPFTSLEKRP